MEAESVSELTTVSVACWSQVSGTVGAGMKRSAGPSNTEPAEESAKLAQEMVGQEGGMDFTC